METNDPSVRGSWPAVTEGPGPPAPRSHPDDVRERVVVREARPGGEGRLPHLAGRQLEALLVQPDPQADVVTGSLDPDAHGHPLHGLERAHDDLAGRAAAQPEALGRPLNVLAAVGPVVR